MKVLAFILGIVGFIVLRSALNDSFHKVVTSATTNKASACVALAGNTTREEEGYTYIVGRIRNTCDHKVDHVTIAFKIDRPSGSKVELPDGPVLAYGNNLQPGETREFKTQFRVAKNATYHFDGITAF